MKTVDAGDEPGIGGGSRDETVLEAQIASLTLDDDGSENGAPDVDTGLKCLKNGNRLICSDAIRPASVSSQQDKTEDKDIGGSNESVSTQSSEIQSHQDRLEMFMNLKTKDRLFVLQMEEIILENLARSPQPFYIIQTESYKRMLIHRICDHYGLRRTVENLRKVTIFQSDSTDMSRQTLKDSYLEKTKQQQDTEIVTEPKKVLKRDTNGATRRDSRNSSSFESNESQSSGYHSSKTLEEKESYYEKVRSKIFQQDSNSGQQQQQGSSNEQVNGNTAKESSMNNNRSSKQFSASGSNNYNGNRHASHNATSAATMCYQQQQQQQPHQQQPQSARAQYQLKPFQQNNGHYNSNSSNNIAGSRPPRRNNPSGNYSNGNGSQQSFNQYNSSVRYAQQSKQPNCLLPAPQLQYQQQQQQQPQPLLLPNNNYRLMYNMIPQQTPLVHAAAMYNYSVQQSQQQQLLQAAAAAAAAQHHQQQQHQQQQHEMTPQTPTGTAIYYTPTMIPMMAMNNPNNLCQQQQQQQLPQSQQSQQLSQSGCDVLMSGIPIPGIQTPNGAAAGGQYFGQPFHQPFY